MRDTNTANTETGALVHEPLWRLVLNTPPAATLRFVCYIRMHQIGPRMGKAGAMLFGILMT